MKKLLSASAASVLVLALAIPAFAGGAHCSGGASATTADAEGSCVGKSQTTAWAGAWLQRTAAGKVSVAEVAKGSPAARSGLKSGDIVLAVNGYNLGNSKDRAECASKAECSVGSSVTYTVQRGSAKKSFRLKLEKMPAQVASRFANHKAASFDPALAAVVIPAVN